MVTIGVLALQGDVAEHVRALENSGARALLVRRVSELDQVDGLVIPGGESTTSRSRSVQPSFATGHLAGRRRR